MRATALAAAAALLVADLGAGTPARADPLAGERTISLIDADGRAHAVGAARFAPDGAATRFEIIWDDARFEEHFLSMRPFKCLEGDAKLWCRAPYPYEIRRRVTAEDLADLEYSLLFVWKAAGSYGIDLWNGVYYALEIDGDAIVGEMREVDLNLLAAPPEDGGLRPIGADDLQEAEPSSHWLPALRIE